jgi:protein phosphatase 1G
MQGWRKRMEDSHISDLDQGNAAKIHCFGVFDGHGGKEVAQYVRVHFTEELVNNASYKSGNLKKALVETFLKMDEMVVENAGKIELKKFAQISKEEDEIISLREKGGSNQNKQMDIFKQILGNTKDEEEIAMMTGCTASVCAIDETNKKIYFANAGDSRSVLCKNGVAYPMSIDHKPDLDTEKNRIYKADGWVSEGRVKGNLNLSRSLGDLEYKQNKRLPPEDQMITAFPDVVVEPLTSDINFIILACDGIWDCMTNQEICDFVSERLKKDPKQKLSKIVEEIMDKCLAPDIYTGNFYFYFYFFWEGDFIYYLCLLIFIIETGVGCDNMTCLIVQFK